VVCGVCLLVWCGQKRTRKNTHKIHLKTMVATEQQRRIEIGGEGREKKSLLIVPFGGTMFLVFWLCLFSSN